MVTFPEYTVSLLLWIAPLCAMTAFFIKKRLLSPEKWYALLFSIALLAAVGIVLDLLFALRFFSFPEPAAVMGITIRRIPIEEFVFYITGFWFILFLYVFCDEWYLKKYNVTDETYARYRAKLKKVVFVHLRGVWWAVGLFTAAFLYKRFFNPGGDFLPGYFTFLLVVAVHPFFQGHPQICQLARVHFMLDTDVAYLDHLGGDAGAAARLLGIPGRCNGGNFHPGLAPPADRGGNRMDLLHPRDPGV
jgi:hypothetical protein